MWILCNKIKLDYFAVSVFSIDIQKIYKQASKIKLGTSHLLSGLCVCVWVGVGGGTFSGGSEMFWVIYWRGGGVTGVSKYMCGLSVFEIWRVGCRRFRCCALDRWE